VSPHPAVDDESDALPERLPDVSTASTLNWYFVPHVSPENAYDVAVVEATRRLPT
jgi:hypothetical protein